MKDPASGRREARLNPKDLWIIEQVPELRILANSLWQAAKQRQTATRLEATKDGNGVRSERARLAKGRRKSSWKPSSPGPSAASAS